MRKAPANDPQAARQRQHRRIRVDFRVRVFALRGRQQVQLKGQANEISRGGISVFVPAELAIDEAVEVELLLPYTSSPTVFKAMVRNRSSFRYGLEFVDVTSEQERLLAGTCSVLELVD